MDAIHFSYSFPFSECIIQSCAEIISPVRNPNNFMHNVYELVHCSNTIAVGYASNAKLCGFNGKAAAKRKERRKKKWDKD